MNAGGQTWETDVPDIRKRSKLPAGPGQPPKDAVLMNIQRNDERWNVYELDDGATVKLRTLVTEIWRIENEFDAEGNPIYVIKSKNVTDVTVPDNLKRK